MLRSAIFITVFSFGIFGQSSSSTGPSVEDRNSPVNRQQNVKTNESDQHSENFVSISELNKQKPGEGSFTTKGFIAKVYTCPPCPPDAQCKPCMKNNIVISEEKKSLKTYDIGETELIVFAGDAKNYAVGDLYELEIRITGKRTTASQDNDIELVSSKRLK